MRAKRRTAKALKAELKRKGFARLPVPKRPPLTDAELLELFNQIEELEGRHQTAMNRVFGESLLTTLERNSDA